MACFHDTRGRRIRRAGKISGDPNLVRHPWELTLREFIEQVRRNYGIEIEVTYASINAGRFLSTVDRRFPAPLLDLDTVMPIPLLEYLCHLFRVPAEDFGLRPEER